MNECWKRMNDDDDDDGDAERDNSDSERFLNEMEQ